MTYSWLKLIALPFLAGSAIVWLSSCIALGDPTFPEAPSKYIRNLTKDSLQIQSQWPDSFHRIDKWELGGQQTLAPLNWGSNPFAYTPSANTADLRVTLLFYGNPNYCYVYSGPFSKTLEQDIRSGSSSSYIRTNPDSAVFSITQSIRDSAKPCE